LCVKVDTVEREICETSVSASEKPLELLELVEDGECTIVCCIGGSAANVCCRGSGSTGIGPKYLDCCDGAGITGFTSCAAAFSASCALSSSRLRSASLRAIVAFLAAAEALAACTRTALRVSLLIPASKATKEMPPCCARGFEDDVFELLAPLPLPLALFPAPDPFGA
jgi:hypothetical protein